MSRIKLGRGINWVDLFMENMKPYGKHILERDETFIVNSNFSKKLNLKFYYNQCTKSNQYIIWTYLQSLFFIGCSYQGYTPDFMSTVERISERCEETK